MPDGSSSVARFTARRTRTLRLPAPALLSTTPPWSGMGWAGAVLPESPGTACGIGNGSPPWSRRRRERWCASERDASCRTTPLEEEHKQINTRYPGTHRKIYSYKMFIWTFFHLFWACHTTLEKFWHN